MKVLVTFCLSLLAVLSYGQAYVHDPALDTINGGVANVDASINGYFGSYGQWLTISNVNDGGLRSHTNTVAALGPAILSITNQTNFRMFSNQIAPAFNFSFPSNNFLGSGTNGATATNSLIQLGTFNGNTYAMDLSLQNSFLSQIQTFFPFVRKIIMGIIYFLFFKYSLEAIREEMFGAINQLQTESPKQSFLGNNLSIILGPIISAAITAMIATLVGAIVANGFSTSMFNGTAAVTTFLTTQSATVASWDVMTAMVPLPEMFVASMNWVLFRYVYMSPLFYAVRAIIRSLGL